MEVEELACVWLVYRRYKARKRRQRKFWVHPILNDRLTHGAFVPLYPNLRKYEPKFFNYVRMSISSFDKLLEIVKDDLTSSENFVRDSISPEEKLVITLRYLATGYAYAELHFSYRVGKSTIGNIIRQVCAAMYKKLKSLCMPLITKEKWEELAAEFLKNTNFPNCIGAIDCKHVRIQQPIDTGSLFFNHKPFFSIVLLSVCDANYRFLFVDVGSYGKSNDSAIFQDSLFYKKLTEGALNLPDSKPISNVDATPLPHVFVADDAFGLSKHIMCPYSGKILPHSKRIFNYRLSRARRYIECTFGIMANKWRRFHRSLNVSLELANSIILACCMLHNFVRERDGYKYEDLLQTAPLVDLCAETRPRPNMYAKNVRDRFARYFIVEGKLSWQDKMV